SLFIEHNREYLLCDGDALVLTNNTRNELESDDKSLQELITIDRERAGAEDLLEQHRRRSRRGNRERRHPTEDDHRPEGRPGPPAGSR
ncbi:hypothetical protein DBV15_12539, partial [Temnothorax longispinosus]